MRNKLLIIIIIAGLSANAEKLVPETLWKLHRVSDPQLSPDGTKVLYNIRSYNLEANKGNSDIWIYDFSSNTSKAIASDSANESSAKWNSNGTRIYYLNDKTSSQLWSMNPDGSDKRQESNTEGDINAFDLSPASNRIWFTKDVKVQKVEGKDIFPDLQKTTGRVYDDLMMRHWDSWADGSFSHIFTADFNNGKFANEKDIMKNEPYDSPLKPDADENEICWSADGNSIAYTCKKLTGKEYAISTNSDIYLYDVQSGITTNVTSDNPGYDKSPAFSPDGKYISWISWNGPGNEAALQRLFIYDLQKKLKPI